MDNFLKEIVNNDELMLDKEFRIQYCAKTIWIVNYIKIMTFNPDKIILKIKGNMFAVEGKNLKIVTMEKHAMVVNGEICAMYFNDKIEK